MHYFTSKGLFVKSISNDRYVIEDIFGTCSIPFNSSIDKLDENLKKIANVQKLVSLGVTYKFPDLSDFNWENLEYYYVAHIHYSFLNSLLEQSEKDRFQSVMGIFPIAYSDCGYGEGSKQTLELIHNQFKEFCSRNDSPVSEKELIVYLTTNQVSRICSDIMSLLNRAMTGYSNLLIAQRDCINESYTALSQLGVSEIVHSGKNSYQVATEITALVISLCSSLDLSAKLIQYINSIKLEDLTFKGARDKQHHEVKRITPKFLSAKFIADITQLQSTFEDLPELIQFRNDLIHSTSAIELEKIYVGLGHIEINDLPLYYSAQYTRDCLESGQPHRFLGRDYFSSGQLDIEVKTLSWLNTVVSYQVEVGKTIHVYLESVKKT
ncbi:hypothetical protein [Colwellia piezophila]|uniref:hypothetical protein n=1 Tax=Colwellia piezophila TaxID=211668 RepID=UPI000370D3E9|nr:hypothetical protein [Colwellia piezophila]